MTTIDSTCFRVTARNPAFRDSKYEPVRQFGLDCAINKKSDGDGTCRFELEMRNTSTEEFTGVIQVAWIVEDASPKFFMPAFLYNRNRGDADPYPRRKGSPALFPRLSTEDKKAPYSDFWMVRADRLSHPVVAVQRLSFGFTAYCREAADERALNGLIRDVYDEYHQAPRQGTGVRAAVSDIAGAIFRDAYVPSCRTYSTRVFIREGTQFQEPLASISWTGGVEVASPMLMAAARLEDSAMREQALSVIQKIVDHSLNPRSNLPYDAYDDDRWYTEGWWDEHLSRPGHSSYLTGQALYYILAGWTVENDFHATAHGDWLVFARRCLNHIETTKDERGEVPYLWSSVDGSGLEYDSFAGCWCVAAAVLLDRISPDANLLASAEKSIEHYWRTYVCAMECYGTPIDTSKAVDSEGILSFIKASRLLHEKTKDPKYLQMLSDGLEYEFTFKFCWNPPIRIDPLKRIGWSSCGGSVTSTCNPHIHPMSNSVCDDIAYCRDRTGDAYFARRLADTVGWGLQTYSTFDGEYDFGKKGWMSERFCHSEGLLIETYENGEPCSTWKCFLPWGASTILEGLCGSIWDGSGISEGTPK